MKLSKIATDVISYNWYGTNLFNVPSRGKNE